MECDFTASETKVIARLEITITLGRLLAAVFTFAFKALIKFLKIMKKIKEAFDKAKEEKQDHFMQRLEAVLGKKKKVWGKSAAKLKKEEAGEEEAD